MIILGILDQVKDDKGVESGEKESIALADCVV